MIFTLVHISDVKVLINECMVKTLAWDTSLDLNNISLNLIG